MGASFLDLMRIAERDTIELACVDLPGLGNSAGEQQLAEMAGPEEMAALTLRFLAEVHEYCFGVRQVAVMGHSFGGYLAILFAKQHKERVSSLTLVAPAGLLPTHGSLGAYWAIFFRWVVPCEPLQCTGA